jgi:hypothetical protein
VFFGTFDSKLLAIFFRSVHSFLNVLGLLRICSVSWRNYGENIFGDIFDVLKKYFPIRDLNPDLNNVIMQIFIDMYVGMLA